MKHMAICNQLNIIFGCDLNWGILSNSYLMGNLIIINVCVFFGYTISDKLILKV